MREVWGSTDSLRLHRCRCRWRKDLWRDIVGGQAEGDHLVEELGERMERRCRRPLGCPVALCVSSLSEWMC